MDYRAGKLQASVGDAVLEAIKDGKHDNRELYFVVRDLREDDIPIGELLRYVGSQEAQAARQRLLDKGLIEVGDDGTARLK